MPKSKPPRFKVRKLKSHKYGHKLFAIVEFDEESKLYRLYESADELNIPNCRTYLTRHDAETWIEDFLKAEAHNVQG